MATIHTADNMKTKNNFVKFIIIFIALTILSAGIYWKFFAVTKAVSDSDEQKCNRIVERAAATAFSESPEVRAKIIFAALATPECKKVHNTAK